MRNIGGVVRVERITTVGVALPAHAVSVCIKSQRGHELITAQVEAVSVFIGRAVGSWYARGKRVHAFGVFAGFVTGAGEVIADIMQVGNGQNINQPIFVRVKVARDNAQGNGEVIRPAATVAHAHSGEDDGGGGWCGGKGKDTFAGIASGNREICWQVIPQQVISVGVATEPVGYGESRHHRNGADEEVIQPVVVGEKADGRAGKQGEGKRQRGLCIIRPHLHHCLICLVPAAAGGRDGMHFYFVIVGKGIGAVRGKPQRSRGECRIVVATAAGNGNGERCIGKSIGNK